MVEQPKDRICSHQVANAVEVILAAPKKVPETTKERAERAAGFGAVGPLSGLERPPWFWRFVFFWRGGGGNGGTTLTFFWGLA